ncbi:adhesion G-protein coupled receptor G5 isoform X2 [Salarias fasciatus]|uniref:adhesion G-protein coupled receptor G5 isoform X2 n=1 Tax=Salarias fasciatus TaxID=181472 RepID=UPI001176AB04|nr:adhesion G-protein coupled receptor G5-like isoform X2 [Salarias fasciatus]
MPRVMSGLLWWLFLCFMSQQGPCLSDPERKHSLEHQSEELDSVEFSQSGQGLLEVQIKTSTKSQCKDKKSEGNKHRPEKKKKGNVNKGKGNPQNNRGSCKNHCGIPSHRKLGVSNARCCMNNITNTLKKGNRDDVIGAIESLEQVLERTDVNETTPMSSDNVVALLHKHRGRFHGLRISASDSEAMPSRAVANSRVSVWLPAELNPTPNDTIVFCMLNVSEGSLGGSTRLYDSRLVGLSLGRTVSGLQERVNISMTLTTSISRNETPECQFYDFSTRKFNKSGCDTEWHRDRGSITCSCDHLTYFGILLLSPIDVSDKDQEILTYITLIGCSLSLFFLLITVLLFATNSQMRADLSVKVHVNLAIALILLNLHFLPSQAAAALQSDGPCLYVAVGLHYSLLATLAWMALEGYHLYRLFIKVFNIYVRWYLLKLSVVGWGLPAVIVSLVAIIDTDSYGRVSMDSSNPNATEICYITDNTVKMVTTLGVFCFVFLFNFIMFGVSVKRIMSFHFRKECGQRERGRSKRAACTLLGISALLGITWGLVFFSQGSLTTPGLYAFCILNSLQGFFIFLWFVLSLRKTRNLSTKTSSETRSTNS